MKSVLGRPGRCSVLVFEIPLTAKAISWRWLCCQLLGWLAVKYGGWESAASGPRQPDGWSPRGEEQQQREKVEKEGEVETGGREDTGVSEQETQKIKTQKRKRRKKRELNAAQWSDGTETEEYKESEKPRVEIRWRSWWWW